VSTQPSNATTPGRRAFRDRPLGRIAILLALLALALLFARNCTGDADNVSQQTAVETARSVAVFEPDQVQLRFLRRGIPPRAYWVVSMYQGTARRPTLVQVVLIDATTGDVADDGIP
jgi:hypothetical protein